MPSTAAGPAIEVGSETDAQDIHNRLAGKGFVVPMGRPVTGTAEVEAACELVAGQIEKADIAE